jgi:acetolactate synthase small subunit
VVVQLAADTGCLEDFISMVKPFGIKEIVRSGAIAVASAKN